MRKIKNKNFLIPIFICNECIIIISMIFLFFFQETYHFFLFSLITLLNIFSFYIYLKIYVYIQDIALSDAQKIIYEKQFQIQKEHQYVQKENYKILEEISHIILQQLKNQNIKTLDSQYINELIQKQNILYQTHFCENQIVDAILYNKSIIAKEYHIPLDIHVYLDNQLAIDPIDLISLYTNLLDNAIEASQRLNENDRYIAITSHCHESYLIIQISNHIFKNQVKRYFQTTKADKKNHGLGMQIIKNVIRKYDGIIDIKTTDTTFQINITLKNR